MLPLAKLLEIQDFALNQKFNVKLIPEQYSDGIDVIVSLNGILLYYNSSEDSLSVETPPFNDDFESYIATMEQMDVIKQIGKMFYEALGKEIEQ